MTYSVVKLRALRLWLVIALPLACWTSYEAWSAYEQANFYRDEATFWLERSKANSQDHNVFDNDRATSTSKTLEKQNAENTAAGFVWLTAALLTLPISGLVLMRLLEWIWIGSKKS